ncbi:hypothetical protein D3C77_475820 [compost metagenome]
MLRPAHGQPGRGLEVARATVVQGASERGELGVPVGAGQGAGAYRVFCAFSARRCFKLCSEFSCLFPVKRPQLAEVGVFVLVILSRTRGVRTDVSVHALGAAEQQAGHAFEYAGNDVDVLQSGSPRYAIGTAGNITIAAEHKGLRDLRIGLKEAEQALEHTLGMGRVLGLLPEKQCDAEGGGIASTEYVIGDAHVVRLFRWGNGEGRYGPVSYGVAC